MNREDNDAEAMDCPNGIDSQWKWKRTAHIRESNWSLELLTKHGISGAKPLEVGQDLCQLMLFAIHPKKRLSSHILEQHEPQKQIPLIRNIFRISVRLLICV